MSQPGSRTATSPPLEEGGRSGKDDNVSSNVPEGRKKKKEDATTGVSAASARAVAARAIAFYFRAPVKAFFRTRVDYMAYARAINPSLQNNQAWSWRTSTPGILGHAVRTHGWSFIPKEVLPPLFANVIVGSVLYTTYLTTLSTLHPPLAFSPKRPFPPPSPSSTFAAGLLAGTLQSLVASPLDALALRFKTSDMLSGRYTSTWSYAAHKTREIGARGIFAGWSISLLKDSLGCAVFFATFEWVKAQGFYSFIRWYYADAGHTEGRGTRVQPGAPGSSGSNVPTVRPHFALEPSFLLLAGLSASVAQSLIQYPLSLLQDLHYHRLASLDALHSRQAGATKRPPSAKETLRNYKHAYYKTFRQARSQAKRAGGLGKWAYRGFLWNTIRSMPATSGGLIVFELVRRRYAMTSEEVRIRVEDGWDVLLV